jgi:hypothetical protein
MSSPNQWPPASGLTTKIVPRTSAILQLSHSKIIHAPASLVFSALLNVSEYPKWNTWVPSVRIDSQPPSTTTSGEEGNDGVLRTGTAMTFHVIMDSLKPQSITNTGLKVMDISTPQAPSTYLSLELLNDPTFTSDLSVLYRVSWTGHGGAYALGMKLERFHEVIVRGEGECEVRTWEVMGGMLSRVVKLMYEKTLEEKLGLWCADLKRWCETKHSNE